MNAVNCISYLFFQETLFIQSNYQHTIYRNNRLGHCQRNSAALQFIQLPNQSLNLRPLGHIGPNQKSDVESFFLIIFFFLERPFGLIFCIKSNAMTSSHIQLWLSPILFGTLIVHYHTVWGRKVFFFWLHLFD